MGAFSIAATVTARSLHDGLHRTSLPIPCAKGVYPPKPLIPILGGPLRAIGLRGSDPHFSKHWPKIRVKAASTSGASLRMGISFLIPEPTRINLLRESPRPHFSSS